MADTTYTQTAGMDGDTTTDNVAELAQQAAASEAAAAADLLLTDADTVATAADRVATNQDTVDTAADLVATNQDTIDTAADAVSTAADVVSTNADAATTAQDAIDTAASESAAATSASNASTSETNAATSETNAAASYDSFDDRYLGAKASDPTLDNDGDALLTGALYFSTSAEAMQVYDGAAWIAAYASLSGAALSANNLSDLANAGTARTNLGVAIGSDVQAYDALLAGIDQSVASGATPTFGIGSMTLDDTSLVVSDTTSLQTFAEGVDSALLRARGTGFTSTYVSTVTVGGTTFAQPAVNGEIHSDQGYFAIAYAGATGITVATLTSPSTYVYIDNANNLQQQTSTPTRQDWSRKMFTMRIAVDISAETIIGFEYLGNPIGHYANSIRDLYKALLEQGVPFKGGQTITGRAADLGFDVSAGTLMEFGGTGNIDNANVLSLDAAANVTYSLLEQSAIVGDETNLVKFWDNAGSITALGSGTFVAHRLYRFSNGNFAIQYGQGNYANIALARAGLLIEDYVRNDRLANATFFGWWIVGETATNTGGTTLTEFREYTIGVQGGSSSSLAGCLLKGNNLSDLLDVSAARTNLGLGTAATTAASAYATAAQGTLADNAAPLASPTFTGTPAAPTATVGTDTTQVATTAFVLAAVPVLANQAEAEAGTSNTTSMSPLRTSEAIAALASGGGMQSMQVFTSSGTYTKPAGITKIKVTVVGGGGGGGNTGSNYVTGSGGAAGGAAIKFMDASSISTITCTVGSGGAAEVSGGTSTFGSTTPVVSTGGVGGDGYGNPTAGGTGSGGDINLKGGDGLGSTRSNNGYSSGMAGGNTIFGGAGSGASGYQSNTPDEPTVGSPNTGGGGGSGCRGAYGAAGGSGIIIIEEFA